MTDFIQCFFFLCIVLWSTETTISAQQQEPDLSRGYIIEVGDTLPAMDMILMDGSLVSSKDWQGKVVMLQFTASWCGVCRKEMPHIEADIWQLYKDREDFVLIGLDRHEPLEKMRDLAEDTGITYPLAYDPGGNIFKLIAKEKSGITRNIIVDKNGVVVMLTRLYDEAEFEAMKELIAELMAE